MKLWASKQRSGLYMLTALKPLWREVGRSGQYDWYMRPGDPVGVRHLCELGFCELTGLDPLESGGLVRVELSGHELTSLS